MNGNILLIYGSLRKGEYNHNFFMKDAELLGTTKVYGYKLYSLGMYSAVYKSGNSDDNVVVEVYRVNDETFHEIRRMEGGAGYVEEIKDVKVGDIYYKGILFTYHSLPEGHPVIETGDWVNRIKKQ